MSTLRIPPGRAGRLRLRHRLEIAGRGADLLEHKLRALNAELAAHREAAAAADRTWREAAEAAREWDGRAAVLGGRRAFEAALPSRPARVSVTWLTAMGVRYPASAECEPPEPAPEHPTPDGGALIVAGDRYRAALPAAVRAAVEQAAVARLEAAVATTRRQVRALRRHWIPAMQAELARVDSAIEQTEHEDVVRRAGLGRPG